MYLILMIIAHINSVLNMVNYLESVDSAEENGQKVSPKLLTVPLWRLDTVVSTISFNDRFSAGSLTIRTY